MSMPLLNQENGSMESETATSPCSMEASRLVASKKIAFLFQPGMLLAAEYLDERPKKTLLGPEKRLMLAVLADAIDGFRSNHSARYGNKRMIFEEVQRWIFEAQGDWVFGFESICAALGLDPEYLREGLVRWRNEQLSNRRSAQLWKGTTVSVSRKLLAKLVHGSLR
jgi:hypothetical protein